MFTVIRKVLNSFEQRKNKIGVRKEWKSFAVRCKPWVAHQKSNPEDFRRAHEFNFCNSQTCLHKVRRRKAKNYATKEGRLLRKSGIIGLRRVKTCNWSSDAERVLCNNCGPSVLLFCWVKRVQLVSFAIGWFRTRAHKTATRYPTTTQIVRIAKPLQTQSEVIGCNWVTRSSTFAAHDSNPGIHPSHKNN
jgi:hypothetical protein